jgi:WD40 repeat protein
VGCPDGKIKIFDIQNLMNGPVKTINLEYNVINDVIFDFTNICYSENGQYLLVSSIAGKIFLVDPSPDTGNQISILTREENPSRFPLQASFTPDSQYIVSTTH